MTSPKSASLALVRSLFKTCVPCGQLERLVNHNEFKTGFVSVRPSFLVPHSSGWFHHHPSLPWPETFPQSLSKFPLLTCYIHCGLCVGPSTSLPSFVSLLLPKCRPSSSHVWIIVLFQSLLSSCIFQPGWARVWLHYSCLCKMLMWLLTVFKSTSRVFLAWYHNLLCPGFYSSTLSLPIHLSPSSLSL